MQLPAGLLLLAFLLRDAYCDVTEEQAEALANADAEAGSEGGRHLGEVSVNNGEETKAAVQHSNMKEYAIDAALLQLEEQARAAGIELTGNVSNLMEQIATEYENGTRQVKPANTMARDIGKRQGVSRTRRWQKGVIPYTFTDIQEEESAVTAVGKVNIENAMKFYEANTCLKFPLLSPTVHAEYGLDHKHFIRFKVPDSGGCFSGVGQGTYGVSCCNQYGVALHEIGHSLGLMHEQNRGDRDWYVALHPENSFKGLPGLPFLIASEEKDNTNGVPNPRMVPAHVKGFSKNGLPTLTITDPTDEFLLGKSEGESLSHYDLMGVTNYYDCTEKCPAYKTTVKCENDGFVNVKCKCRCPDLFSGERCENLYKPPAAVTAWPTGSYGLPDSVGGCPTTGTWSTGSRTHFTKGKAKQQHDFLKPFTTPEAVDNFCMKSDAASGSGDWPAGTYCIYQQGDSCPTGFKSGSITLDDDNNKAEENSVNGSLPKGVFKHDTQYFYCCRNDKDARTPINLPIGRAFNLFRFGATCQRVHSMRNKGHWLEYAQMDTAPTTATTPPCPDFGTKEGNFWIYYCYYIPLNYDCGGTIELTETNPSVNISSPNYPQNYTNLLECVWHIKAPEGKHLALDFNDFDLEQNSDKDCLDSVEVRRTLVAQPGQKYCGHGFKRSILIDEVNFIMMILRTDNSGTRKGFTSTVRIISDAEQCINSEDRGMSYRGKVDYTQHYQKCIPWEQAKHCSVNPFAREFVHSGLTSNSQCRNPNNLLRPWCYINAYCEYDFCDVCGVAKCYDYFEDCAELTGKDSKHCSTEDAFHGCHKTCKYCGRGHEKLVSSCVPPVVKDKHAVIDPAKASQATFKFGEKVKVVCKNKIDDTPVTSELMCTTDGQYEGMELLCGIACPEGWTRYRENCYKFVEKDMTRADAENACRAENAHLVSIRDAEENEYVQQIVKSYSRGWGFWVGIGRGNKDEAWRWDDGLTQNYTNWKPEEPEAKMCAQIEADGLWNDLWCGWKRYSVCKKPHREYDSDYYCVDEDPNCYDIIVRNHKVCKHHRDFSFARCRHSCGLCPVMDCPNPGIISNTVQRTTESYIRPGDYLEYDCSSGYELASGNLGRMCLMNGTIAGSRPVCKPEEEFEDTYGHRVIERATKENAEVLTVYDSKESNIRREGKVIRWEVYSTKRTTLMAQVWRRNEKDENTFTLIGQTLLTLRPKRLIIYTLKSFEAFYVKNGDLLGWYTPWYQGLTYSECDSDEFANRTTYQSSQTNMYEVQVGMQRTIPLKEKCRTYSIAVTIGAGGIGTNVNVAAASQGATCVDASSNKDICGLAIDGGLMPYNNAWMTANEGVGSFITINFAGEYNVVGAKFMQRLSKTGQNQKLTLTFSDGSTQKVGLSQHQGTSAMETKAASWNTFDLTPVMTSSVKIMVDTVYSTDYNGFIEIEMYAVCPDGWILHKTNCYKKEDTLKKWLDAEAACQTYSSAAHLASITSEEENSFVKTLLSGHTWIGLNDKKVENKWTWADGSDASYINWDTSPNNWNEQDCVEMFTKGTWDDSDCDDKQQYLCELHLDNKKQTNEVTLGNPVQPRGNVDGSGDLGYIYLVQGSNTLTVPKSGSIMAWKLYSNSDYDVTMMVLRPGETGKYTLVGENTVSTKGKVTNLIDIKPIDRIKVTAGDIIAWYYPPGQNPKIPYDSCSSTDVKTKWIKHPTSEPLNVDDTVTSTGGTTCRTYSISYILTEEQTPFENVAALTSLATCSAASSGLPLCDMTLDGKLTDWDSAWIPDSPPIGQSFDIKFADTFSVDGGRIMQRMSATAQIKSIKVDFGNGKTTTVQLKKRQGSSDGDYTAQMWDTFSLDQTVDTKLVKITIAELYTQARQTTDSKVGIIEVQLLSTGCPVGWTRYRDNCYKQNPTVQLYAASEGACQQQGAHVSSVKDQGENDFLLKLSNGQSLYLGYTWDGNKWVAADGSTMTYDNWKSPPTNPDEYPCISLENTGKWDTQWCQWHYAKPVICKKLLTSNQQLPYSFVGNTAQPRYYKDGSGYVNVITLERSSSMTFTRSGSVKAWKVYSNAEADITMMVVRPVEGSITKFTIVGENVITLSPAKTNVYTIASFDRINVQAGDIIAWFYLPGSDPTIPFGKCKSSDTKIIWSDVPQEGPFIVGGEVSGTITTSTSACRTYSISALLDHIPAPTVYNIARRASCTASTSSSICSLAVDGGMFAFSSAWISRGEGVGAWLELTLQGKYPIIGSRIQQRLASSSRIKELEFTFSDGSTQLVKFGERVGKNQVSYGSKAWDVFALKNVNTTSVKLTVKAVYGRDEVGFIEVQMISGGCIEGWTIFRGSCYKYHDIVKTWEQANKYCISLGAHLATISDKAEMDFVRSLISSTAFSKYSFIGYHLVNGKWMDVLGMPATYTNWKDGEGTPQGDPCVGIYASNGEWFDTSCTRWTYNFTCERMAGVSMTPVKMVGGAAEPRSSTDGAGKIVIADRTENRFTEAGRVTAWKVYSKKKSVAVLSVYRPIPNTSGTFAFVGSNSVETEEGRVTYVPVPDGFQINVLPNDVIGMQFPWGDVGIPYSTCNNNEVNMNSYELKSSWSNPSPGQHLTLNSLSSYYPCRTYSMSAVVEGVKERPPLTNIAAAGVGTTCEASDNKEKCGKVIDGDIAPASEWSISTSPVTGNWIKLTFKESYTVQFISIMQRFGADGQTKDVTLEFSNSTSQTVTLKQRLSGSNTNTQNGFWDDFEINKVETTFIKFTVSNVYTESKNGFVEIRVFAGCSTGFVRHKDRCYKLVKEELKYFPARDKCRADGVMLVRVDNADENKFLRTLAGDEKIWIGFRDNYIAKPNAVWGWEDANAYTYTNWANDNPTEVGTSGYCATLDKDGLWRDHKAWGYYSTYWFVCEKAAPRVNEELPYSHVGHPAVPESKVDGDSNIKYMYIERSAAMTFKQSGTVKAWKLYSTSAVDIIMMVVRPVEGSNIKFNVVGMNDIKAQNGKTEIEIATSDRISVKSGDILVWYYSPGSSPTISYSECDSTEVTILWCGPGPLAVAQEVSCTISSWRPCRIYSVGALLDHSVSGRASELQETTDMEAGMVREGPDDVSPPLGVPIRQHNPSRTATNEKRSGRLARFMKRADTTPSL